jgi:cytochrome c biogenesis protein CcdA
VESLSLSIVFWYGILHAFGPDHLTAIADFSIGKHKRKTLLITLLFAMGHGTMLFVFAKILETYNISEQILGYGDLISSSVILGMGVYLLYLVFANKIHLSKHIHNNKEHVHIYFGNEHNHNNNAATSAFAIGALMGIGGVRGMLITLGAIQGQNVDFAMVLAFTLGVMVIFLAFGVVILYINQNLLNNKSNIRKIFATAGIVSVLVGGNMLFANEPIHGHSHSISSNNTIKKLVDSKDKSGMTYKQLMNQMGKSFEMIQTGILTQNKELVILGATLINNHPAPKTKPWLIMKENEQNSFKQSLIEYDKLLHNNLNDIINIVSTDDYIKANVKVFELSNNCISCHNVWQNKTIN